MNQISLRKTPGNVLIKPRKVDFNLDHIPRHWNGGDPVKTHFLNAFSSILPIFEQFFITTILKNRARIEDPTLKTEIQGFCAQEGAHAQVHRKYNLMLEKQGYTGIRFFEKIQTKVLNSMLKLFPDNLLLALTASGEHVTSFMGHDFLADPERWSKGSHPTMDALWKWHATEEVEHKAVCFDTYQSLSGSRIQRIFAMVLISTPTLLTIMGLQLYMLGTDRLLLKTSTWKNFFTFMAGRDGFFRKLWSEYLKFLKKDFHPWQNDDRHLIGVNDVAF